MSSIENVSIDIKCCNIFLKWMLMESILKGSGNFTLIFFFFNYCAIWFHLAQQWSTWIYFICFISTFLSRLNIKYTDTINYVLWWGCIMFIHSFIITGHRMCTLISEYHQTVFFLSCFFTSIRKSSNFYLWLF